MNTEPLQSLGMWVRRHLSGPAEAVSEPPEWGEMTAKSYAEGLRKGAGYLSLKLKGVNNSCIECGRVIDTPWLGAAFYCFRCNRRHRIISLAQQAYYLAVEMDEVAATLLAGAVDRLERER